MVTKFHNWLTKSTRSGILMHIFVFWMTVGLSRAYVVFVTGNSSWCCIWENGKHSEHGHPGLHHNQEMRAPRLILVDLNCQWPVIVLIVCEISGLRRFVNFFRASIALFRLLCGLKEVRLLWSPVDSSITVIYQPKVQDYVSNPNFASDFDHCDGLLWLKRMQRTKSHY